jgi:hypothetical protein
MGRKIRKDREKKLKLMKLRLGKKFLIENKPLLQFS